jgi:hypothetical protein
MKVFFYFLSITQPANIGDMEVNFSALWTLPLDEGEWSLSYYGYFTLVARASVHIA